MTRIAVPVAGATLSAQVDGVAGFVGGAWRVTRLQP